MIYFIQQGHSGPIKIGYSANPATRLRELQTSHHANLRMLGEIDGGINDERRLHQKFAAHRIRREWFTPSQDAMDYIRMALGADPFGEWLTEEAQRREAEYRAEEGYKPRRPVTDLEIVPPTDGTGGWQVKSRQADLAVYESTLEDALFSFINDCSLGHEFGWDAVRFPLDKKDLE